MSNFNRYFITEFQKEKIKEAVDKMALEGIAPTILAATAVGAWQFEGIYDILMLRHHETDHDMRASDLRDLVELLKDCGLFSQP